MKGRDRKLPRYFSRLDTRPQSGEPAAAEASEQKNRDRFRTGKVRTGWWRGCLSDWWLCEDLCEDYWWTWRWCDSAEPQLQPTPLSSDHWSITRLFHPITDQNRETEPGIGRVLLRCLIQDSVHFLLLRHPGHHRNRRPRTCGTGLPGTESVPVQGRMRWFGGFVWG